ncbi:MAG: SPFH domain-containing protein, partial [Myxococcota bacterium]
MRYLVAIVGLLVAGFIGASLSTFIVTETDQVVITQFGRPVGSAITQPGLHWRWPFIQEVNRFEKRFLEWDGERNQIPTSDKRFIFVDTYARWRISDPLKFFERLGDERGAQTRLDDILDGETRNVIARHNLIEVVRTSGREFALDDEDVGGLSSGIREGDGDDSLEERDFQVTVGR